MQCPICQESATSQSVESDDFIIECPECGSFKIADTLLKMLDIGRSKFQDIDRCRNWLVDQWESGRPFPRLDERSVLLTQKCVL